MRITLEPDCQWLLNISEAWVQEGYVMSFKDMEIIMTQRYKCYNCDKTIIASIPPAIKFHRCFCNMCSNVVQCQNCKTIIKPNAVFGGFNPSTCPHCNDSLH